MRIPLFLMISLLLTAPAVCAAGPATAPAHHDAALADNPDVLPLTAAAELRDMSAEQANQKLPVRVRGVVTYQATLPQMLFLQDETGGVCVSGVRDREFRTPLKAGLTVEVEGVTAWGVHAAYVTNRPREFLKITIVGDGLPVSPQPVKMSELTGTRQHGNFIELTGIVRTIRGESIGPNGQEAMVVTLASGADRVEATLLGRNREMVLPTQWVGAMLRVRGVFNVVAPERAVSPAMRVLIPALRDFKVISAARPPYELPVSTIDSLAASTDSATAPAAMNERFHIKAVVTLPVPEKGLYVQDETAGTWIDVVPPEDVKSGDQVEVVGFPTKRGWAIGLEDVVWKATGHAAAPAAPLVTADQALNGQLDSRLVRMEALVLDVSRLAEGPTLVLQSGERVFLARLANPQAGLPTVHQDSWVRVSGVCVNNRSPADGRPADASRPVSFHLLLGSSEAIEVIRTPSWWTLQRIAAVFGVLALLTLAALAWNFILRRRVTRQTATIQQHMANRTLYEERVRIARELHDSLEQDLLGITMQLNATEKLLTNPDRAKQSLQLAAAMVRRSQAETHRAVWDLRDTRQGKEGLVGSLREAVAGLTPGHAQSTNGQSDDGNGDGASHGPSIEVRLEGEPRPLAPQVENHLLRVALEAVTNALKHAGARHITIDLLYGEEHVSVKVTDDGKGFDTALAPPPSSGHFGLFGMRERAEKLHASLAIDSRAGEGTSIQLQVPAAQA